MLTILKASEKDAMHEHLNTFFDIVSKLENMDLINHDDIVTTLLLHSLPASYENFASNMSCREALPSPDECKLKIIEQFEWMRSKTNRDDGAMWVSKASY